MEERQTKSGKEIRMDEKLAEHLVSSLGCGF